MLHLRSIQAVEIPLRHLHGAARRPSIKLSILFLAVFTATESAVADEVVAPSSAVKAKIDAVIQAEVSHGVTPGIAVAVGKGGQTVYQSAAGVRDVSSRAPMLVTTPQPIGSVTKSFTAVAILMLQQDKRLSVDDRLSKYVPEYVHTDNVTLRQLVTMVSGISDNDPAIYGDHLIQPISRQAMIANLNKLPLMWPPEAHMAYTNTNYNLLGLVVERASGGSYLTFLRERMFKCLGMSSTSTVDQPPPGIAAGYFHEKPGQPFTTRPELSPDFLFGTGNLVSTAPDLLKWDAALLSKRLLDEASLRSLFTVPGNGKITTIKETDQRFPAIKHVSDGSPTIYAMGWMLPNPYTRWHGGHTFLFESANALFSDGYAIAIIGNVRDGGAFDPGNLAANIHNILNPALTVPPLNVVARPATLPIESPSK